MHTRVSGVNDHLAENEAQALARLREIVASLPPAPLPAPPNPPRPPRPPLHDPAELDTLVPTDPKQPYVAREIVARLVDGSEWPEFKPDWGTQLVTGFASIHGHPVGILGNNGALVAEAALKGTHFIELANQRDVPLLFLQNIAGFMVGSEAERGGISKHSANMVYAVSCARVPKLTLIVGGSYGALNITREIFERAAKGREFALFFKRFDPITAISESYHDVPVGEVLCKFNAANHLELAINTGKASSLLGLKVEETIQIDFYDPGT